jgi:hypothetical protein
VRLRQMRRLGGVVLATAAAITVLAGCGSSSGKAPTSSASPGGGFGANGTQAYITCLNQHGVTIALPSRAPGQTRPSGAPRPSRSPGSTGGGFGGGFGGGGGGAFGGGIFNNASNPPTGVSQSAWTAALAACKSVQPSFSRSGGAGFGGGGNSAFTAYLNCLQQHGVTASRGPGGAGGFNSADPKLAAAEKACAPLRPTTGRPSSSPTG